VAGVFMTEFCTCEDWEPCGCGNQPPPHCMYCCLDLTQEQLAAFNFNTDEHIPPRPKSLPILKAVPQQIWGAALLKFALAICAPGTPEDF
jgi:hypothetical protein